MQHTDDATKKTGICTWVGFQTRDLGFHCLVVVQEELLACCVLPHSHPRLLFNIHLSSSHTSFSLPFSFVVFYPQIGMVVVFVGLYILARAGLLREEEQKVTGILMNHTHPSDEAPLVRKSRK